MRQALERDGHRCFYCEKAVVWRRLANVHKPDDATLDHIIPKSKDGEMSIENVVLACRACNGKRGDLPAEEFLRRKLQSLFSKAA